MQEPLRVLHFQGRMGQGGAETFMMNAYRNIDRSKIQFDFLIYEDYKDVTPYHQEIKALGGKIYVVPNPNKHIFAYIKTVKKLLKDKKIDIVHSEIFFGGGINLWIAKKVGIKKRIVHSHATSDGKGNRFPLPIIRQLFHYLIKNNATDYLACSHEAGVGLFGENQPFIFVANGIDLEKYRSVPKSKGQLREELMIPSEAFVVGNIGRFEEQKNHRFLINLFEEIVKLNPTSHLILVGTGSLQDEIKEKVKNKAFSENVHFLGERKDIPELLKAMDVFLLPSLYEGLPIVAVEAQAANLKLVLSTEVSKETQLSENVHFISLDTLTKEWAEVVLAKPYANTPRPELEVYDMKKTASQLEKIYLK